MNHWYALQSKPNREEALYKQVTSSGTEVYYPRIRVKPVNPRARKIKAYFPGYMFVYVDLIEKGLSYLQYMPFARGLVCYGKDPAPVPNDLLEAIRQNLENLNAMGGHLPDGLETGTPVRVESGPFTGFQGIFDTHLSGSDRVRILIELITHEYMAVQLPASQVKKISK